jgi:hypothetical protein
VGTAGEVPAVYPALCGMVSVVVGVVVQIIGGLSRILTSSPKCVRRNVGGGALVTWSAEVAIDLVVK